MKKIAISILLIIPILLLGCSVKALDNREVLTSVVATSNTSSIPIYGEVIISPTFNITAGTEARFELNESNWRVVKGGTTLTKMNGYKFFSGSWHYRVKVVLDGEIGTTLRLGDQTKITIDGVDWDFSYCSTCATENTSSGYAYSPSYVLENNGELYYFEDNDYRVYTNYIGVDIISFSLAGTVEGGTEPFVFSKTSGPEWINISSDGMISGKPTEIGENINAVVRVTDANNNFKEINVPIGKTVLPPNLKEPVGKIEATSNIDSIPVIGSDIVVPTFNMVTTEGAHFAGYAGGWYKLVGSNWKLQSGKFTPGKWQYRSEVRLEGEAAEMQKLTEDTIVIVDDIEWNSALSGVGTEFYSLSVKSPEYNLVGTINSIELDGSIKAPKVGEDIVDPIIFVKSINSDNTLNNLADVEASWQYKTGDGFFDWADATGKFESNKTYHIRFLVTVNSDSYELDNIANFPVTFNNYNLTQFQLNNKTIGEFIEFENVKSIEIPIVNITYNNNKVTISWNPQEVAVKYKVYRSIDGNKYYKVADITDNKYIDKNLTYNKTYYYKVKACSTEKCSGYSEVVSKKVRPNKVNLSIKSAGTNNVKLGWDKVGTTGYEVYSSTDNKKWSKQSTITKNNILELNIKKLKANKTYYFKVRAYKNISGKKYYGPYSIVVSTKTAPTKPSFSVKLKDYNAMNLVIGEAKGATKYIVQKSLDGKIYAALEELTKYGTLVDSGNEIGKTYYYAVKVCNSQNRCSGWVHANLKQTTKTPSLKVESLTSKKVSVTVGSVNGADGYRVYRATSKNGEYTFIKEIFDGDELMFNDSTTKGKTYYYKVRSYKKVDGNKIYSSFSSIKSIVSK